MVRGRLEVRSGSGVTMAAWGPGDVFGELAAITGRLRCADVVATEHTDLMVIGRTALLERLRDPVAARELLAVVAGRPTTLSEHLGAPPEITRLEALAC